MPCLQILYNLVGNSAKFTTDGSITVMLKAMQLRQTNHSVFIATV